MILDRKKRPTSEDINFVLPVYNKEVLKNKSSLYAYQGGDQDVVKIEFVFDAGEIYATHPLMAMVTNKMLDEGTKTRTSKQISDAFDYYGAFIELSADKECATVSLYTLNKYYEQVLPLMIDIIVNPIFLQSELDLYASNAQQNFLTNEKKNSFLSKRYFIKHLFEGNRYGNIAELKDYQTLTSESLIDFHAKHYALSNATIFLSGRVEPSHIEYLNKILDFPDKASHTILQDKAFTPTQSTKLFYQNADSVQTSIRIGCVTVNRKHADYPKVQLLNTILGGYFGSRLMSNIREEKGYTYGIGSSISSMKGGGMFMISTEVGTEFTQATLDEIYKEIKLLQNWLVEKDELEKVKNYMLGGLLRNFDGPFETANRLKAVVLDGLDFEYYHYYINTIKSATAEDLKGLANKYFNENNLLEVVVGKK